MELGEERESVAVHCKDFFFRYCRKNSNSLCKQPDLTTLGHIQYMHCMCILQLIFAIALLLRNDLPPGSR